MYCCLCLEECGKLQSVVESAAYSATDSVPCCNSHLFMVDRNTGLQFLVDSGADVSIVPYKQKPVAQVNSEDDDFHLYAANGTRIPTYGTKILEIDLGLMRAFKWPFIIAKTSRGILGADFLRKFNLLIDLKRQQLVDGDIKLCKKGELMSISSKDIVSTLVSENFNKFSLLLNNYSELTRPNFLSNNVNHNVKYHIVTTGQPVYCKPRRLDNQKFVIAKQEFQFKLDNGIIQPSKSQWTSPLHMVQKKNGS